MPLRNLKYDSANAVRLELYRYCEQITNRHLPLLLQKLSGVAITADEVIMKAFDNEVNAITYTKTEAKQGNYLIVGDDDYSKRIFSC